MKKLTKMHLVQYSFWDYETFNLHIDGTAFIGPNGAGKTSLLDAFRLHFWVRMVSTPNSILNLSTRIVVLYATMRLA